VEAVENHMPEIIMVDEIGTEAEALACRTIAERGVQLVATAHGQLLENLIKNPTLSDLVGGIQSVTLGMTTHVKCTHSTYFRVAKCVGT
jgi:stage III sporulation protein SpoIIIAA